MLITSTPPQFRGGIFWELFNQASSGATHDMFVARRPTWEMNPHISRTDLEPEYLADPEGAAVEYGAEFGEGAGAYLEAAAVHDCVARGRRAIPPESGLQYAGAADPAFAAGGDAFTFAIGHRRGDGEAAVVILDVLRAWKGRNAPLSSDQVLDEIDRLCRAYRISEITSDQFAVVPLADAFRRRGLVVRQQALTNELKADVFGALKRTINTGRIELLDDPQLLAELIRLEVRPTAGGRPRIQAAAGGHEDRARAVASLVHRLTRMNTYLAMDYFDHLRAIGQMAGPEQQSLPRSPFPRRPDAFPAESTPGGSR